VGVSTSCAADIDAMCAEQKNKLRGNATVLRCLVDNYKKSADACQVRWGCVHVPQQPLPRATSAAAGPQGPGSPWPCRQPAAPTLQQPSARGAGAPA
jgi:hypothetical protein